MPVSSFILFLVNIDFYQNVKSLCNVKTECSNSNCWVFFFFGMNFDFLRKSELKLVKK